MMRALNPRQEKLEDTTLLDCVCELVECHEAIPRVAARLAETRGTLISTQACPPTNVPSAIPLSLMTAQVRASKTKNPAQQREAAKMVPEADA